MRSSWQPKIAFAAILFGILAIACSTIIFASTFMMWSPGGWLFIVFAPLGLLSIILGLALERARRRALRT